MLFVDICGIVGPQWSPHPQRQCQSYVKVPFRGKNMEQILLLIFMVFMIKKSKNDTKMLTQVS